MTNYLDNYKGLSDKMKEIEKLKSFPFSAEDVSYTNKANQNVVSYKITTGIVALNFPHLFEPYSFFQDQEKKYSTTLLVSAGSETEKELMKIINTFHKKGIGKATAQNSSNLKPLVFSIKNKNADGHEEHEVVNVPYFNKINASSKIGKAPIIIDSLNKLITSEDDQRLASSLSGVDKSVISPSDIVSGAIGVAKIVLSSYSNEKGAGITSYLQSIRIVDTSVKLVAESDRTAEIFNDIIKTPSVDVETKTKFEDLI